MGAVHCERRATPNDNQDGEVRRGCGAGVHDQLAQEAAWNHFQEACQEGDQGDPHLCQKEMKTSDVRLDVKLNRAVWANGVKNVPRRLRIQIQRRKNDDEDASEEMYSIVTAVDGVAVSQPTVVVE